MIDVGRSVALAALGRNGVVCSSSAATVLVADDRVVVTVRCTTEANGLSPLADRTVTAIAVSPIDRYRAE
jgi:hypothetical protein